MMDSYFIQDMVFVEIFRGFGNESTFIPLVFGSRDNLTYTWSLKLFVEMTGESFIKLHDTGLTSIIKSVEKIGERVQNGEIKVRLPYSVTTKKTFKSIFGDLLEEAYVWRKQINDFGLSYHSFHTKIEFPTGIRNIIFMSEDDVYEIEKHLHEKGISNPLLYEFEPLPIGNRKNDVMGILVNPAYSSLTEYTKTKYVIRVDGIYRNGYLYGRTLNESSDLNRFFYLRKKMEEATRFSSEDEAIITLLELCDDFPDNRFSIESYDDPIHSETYCVPPFTRRLSL